MLKLSREFVITKLKELDADELEINNNYDDFSDDHLMAEFCLSGLFDSVINGDPIGEEDFEGLY